MKEKGSARGDNSNIGGQSENFVDDAIEEKKPLSSQSQNQPKPITVSNIISLAP